MTTTRRRFLGLSGGALLSGLLPAPAPAEPGEFSFLAVNDLHYRDERCRAWLEGVMRRMRAEEAGPRFLLVCGDLANDGRGDQIRGVRGVLEGLGLPYYPTIGNHDHADDGTRQDYEAAFPDRLNYRFEHAGWHFLGLDTSEKTKYTGTTIAPETLRFVDGALAAIPREAPIVVFTHFPLGFATPMRPVNADALVERFKDHNLRAAFSGHFHGLTERRWRNAVLTTHRCCSLARDNHDGTKPEGYFLCRAAGGEITRKFVEVPQE